MVYMILTCKGYLGPDIWPKTPNQVGNTESMMRTMWNTEAMRRRKSSGKPKCPLGPTEKKARHVRALFFYD